MSTHESFITITGSAYRIARHQSIFTNRNGLSDVYIQKECRDHGALYRGKRYAGLRVLCAHTGDILRDYGVMPAEISPQWLTDNAFIDGAK
jgi:hypothetical protein